MCLIEDFFLDKKRIRKVVKKKIEGELHFDFVARQALDGAMSQTDAEAAVTKWGDHYRVLRIDKKVRPDLVKAIINGAPQIKRNLEATSPEERHTEIIQRHAEIYTLCNAVQGVRNKDGGERDFKALPSKLLWLLHPSKVPIFDDLAWRAINVVARLAEKVETPDPEDKSASTLNEFCAFLKLHALCFSGIYERIDEIISEEFDTIFDSATRQTAITKEDAAHQYANHITVIDQILVHLGGAVPVEGCLIKKTGKKGTKKLVESVASVKSVA
jgi:hypothetical protein